jgi:hypothetical protein
MIKIKFNPRKIERLRLKHSISLFREILHQLKETNQQLVDLHLDLLSQVKLDLEEEINPVMLPLLTTNSRTRTSLMHPKRSRKDWIRSLDN